MEGLAPCCKFHAETLECLSMSLTRRHTPTGKRRYDGLPHAIRHPRGAVSEERNFHKTEPTSSQRKHLSTLPRSFSRSVHFLGENPCDCNRYVTSMSQIEKRTLLGWPERPGRPADADVNMLALFGRFCAPEGSDQRRVEHSLFSLRHPQA